LHRAHRLADHVGVRQVAHTLKSSSASIGAVNVTRLCVEIENAIHRNVAQDLDARVAALSVEVRHALHMLGKLSDAPR
jgi:HPt (histidine-containing phosphotransfer) domain-containing protein